MISLLLRSSRFYTLLDSRGTLLIWQLVLVPESIGTRSGKSPPGLARLLDDARFQCPQLERPELDGRHTAAVQKEKKR